MIKCPICGKYDFAEEDDYDICTICGWENDGLQMSQHDYAGGANWLSVNQARENYRCYGIIMTEKDKKEKTAFYKAHVAPDGTWIP
jgi:hypothetical protein